MILDSLYIAGIPGGITFIIASLVGVYRAIKLVKYDLDYGWMGMLYLNFWIHSMFSGAMIKSPYFWFSLVFVLTHFKRMKNAGRLA